MGETALYIPGLIAAASLSSSQYRAVRLTAAWTVGAFTNANAPQEPLGVLQNDPDAAGEPCSVIGYGATKGEAGASYSVGDRLGLDNVGRFITAAFEAAIGAADLYVCAVALEAAGAQGDYMRIWFTSPVPGSTE